MALDANILGTALYTAANAYNDQDIQNLEQARRDFWKAVAQEIVTHIVTQGVVTTTGTAAAQTGKLT